MSNLMGSFYHVRCNYPTNLETRNYKIFLFAFVRFSSELFVCPCLDDSLETRSSPTAYRTRTKMADIATPLSQCHCRALSLTFFLSRPVDAFSRLADVGSYKRSNTLRLSRFLSALAFSAVLRRRGFSALGVESGLPLDYTIEQKIVCTILERTTVTNWLPPFAERPVFIAEPWARDGLAWRAIN